jgi:23S rRNA maturation mini-RNase III
MRNVNRAVGDAAIATLGDAMKERVVREELIKEYEARAAAYDRKAQAQPAAISEMKSYYRAKAEEARQRVRELRSDVAKDYVDTSKTISIKLGERVAR